MQNLQQRAGGVMDKARFVAYGFVTGLILGIILGFIIEGIVRTFFWVALFLVPIVLAFLFYQRITSRNRYERERERVVVRTPDSDRILVTRGESDSDTIRDAEWRDPV